jgi:xanthine dehydrogenase large subunit
MDDVVAAEMKQADIRGRVGKSHIHDSAAKHVSGEATYIDDIPVPQNCLHMIAAMSQRAHAKIKKLDVSKVRTAPGVALVLTANDLPGVNDISPTGTKDEPVLAEGTVHFHGQPIFAVAADTIDQARAAARLAEVEYDDLEPLVTVEAALAADEKVLPTEVLSCGDAAARLDAAPHRRQGKVRLGGQEHFYLEGHISLAVPQEDGDVLVHCSTQHPSEVQHNVAHVLGRPNNAVTVEVRRMGGGFGGKETQGAQWAALAAVTAVTTGRPAKFCLDRDDDMIMTGKRHDFIADYDVGYDDDGRILALDVMLAARCGFSADLSGAIADRAMFHIDNGYYLSDLKVTSHRSRTNTVSNCAFRGFGGPQGMVVIERIIDDIARVLQKEPLDVRKINLYGDDGRNVTPYQMTVEDNELPEMVTMLEQTSDYAARKKEIADYNASSRIIKRGIAMTPVKFGISFTTTFLNQAGALIHLYTDGSVHLNHGGTEMGQGLFLKVAQVVAHEFSIDIDNIKISATNTGKVPNTSATAASSGTDMNGMAAQAAARTLKQRLIDFATEQYDVAGSDIVFDANKVRVGEKSFSFAELVNQAYLNRVQLSATGFYKTPKIHYDRETFSGRPFLYFAYGVAVSEVKIDTLTGETRTTRVDILHDVGSSLNPAIDEGQIEGGFIQGMGWLTSEELVYADDGRLLTHAPSTYKIPACADRPEEFNLKLWPKGRNREETIHRSKAVGEPPLMLAISVHHAIAEAVGSVGAPGHIVALDAPATPECVLDAVDRARASMMSGEKPT